MKLVDLVRIIGKTEIQNSGYMKAFDSEGKTIGYLEPHPALNPDDEVILLTQEEYDQAVRPN